MAVLSALDGFGFLSPEQVVSILFDTARDLGEPGPDEIYGHGVLDLNAAMSAAGAGDIPSDGGGGGGGGGGGVVAAALLIGGAAAFITRDKEEELQKTILVDSYGRGFQFDLPGRINVRGSAPNIFSLQQRHKTSLDNVILDRTENSYTQASYGQREVSSFSYTSADKKYEDYVSFLHHFQTPVSEYALGLNADLSTNFGALSVSDHSTPGGTTHFTSNDLFSTPVLGYSSMGSSFMYGWNNDVLNHRFGVSVIDDQEKYGRVSNSVLYESSVQKERFRLGYQVGALVEDGSMYGGSSDGPLSVDSTSTYYLGVNGSFNLTRDIRVIGGYFQGMSSVDDSSSSLLSDFSGLRSEGYALGLVANRVFSDRDSFGVSYSSPLQTTSGSATLTVPVSQDYNTGAISFDSSGVDFDTANREKVLEMYYNYRLNRRSSVFTHLSYTGNPTSNLDASRDRTVFVGWKRSF